jgi:hypothetical protein
MHACIYLIYCTFVPPLVLKTVVCCWSRNMQTEFLHPYAWQLGRILAFFLACATIPTPNKTLGTYTELAQTGRFSFQ